MRTPTSTRPAVPQVRIVVSGVIMRRPSTVAAARSVAETSQRVGPDAVPIYELDADTLDGVSVPVPSSSCRATRRTTT
jgi:hypothetical protein